MRLLRWLRARGLNVWIALVLIVANLYVWTGTLLAAPAAYIVEPVRAPQAAVLLDHIQAGGHSGETFDVTVTDLEVEQTVTWYLQRYPQVPFAHPRIRMTPDDISGDGDATIAGLRIHVSARVRVALKDGLPVVTILELNLPLPPPIRAAVERELATALGRAAELPVRFTSAEWGQGQVRVKGVIR